MAGSAMTFTYDDGVDGAGKRCGVRKVIADWISDDSAGTVSGTTRKLVGKLVKAVTNPGATAPTANYDIALTDAESVNILTACQNTLADRHTSSTEEVYFLVKDTAGTPLAQSLHPVICDPILISISAAGNSKEGRLILYVAD